MWNDPIVAETRELRDQIARRHNYDVVALGEYFKGKSIEDAKELIAKAVEANDTEVKSAHEPNAPLMSADDVLEDAQRMRELLQRKRSKTEPIIRLPIPFSIFISALEQFSRDELMMVHQRIEERLVT